MLDARALLALALAFALSACAPPQPAECPCKGPAENAAPPAEPPVSAASSSSADDAHSHAHAHAEAATDVGSAPRTAADAKVVPHAGLHTFRNTGATLVGLATPSLGAREVEVWRSSIAAGSRTPVHTHASEEVFIVLSGSGVAHVGDQAIPFEAPATLIAPAGVPHWVENTGTVPTDQIVVVGPGSEIRDAEGKVMDLPWRK